MARTLHYDLFFNFPLFISLSTVIEDSKKAPPP